MAASTGSPASRRPTKLTPLTTRPSFTSRQGMTRTFSITFSPKSLASFGHGGDIHQRTAAHRFGGNCGGLGQHFGVQQQIQRLTKLFLAPAPGLGLETLGAGKMHPKPLEHEIY